MAKYLSNIDLNKNQLQNAALHPVGTTPATPVEGQVYFDTREDNKMMYFWDNTAWVAMGSQGDITAIETTTSAQLTVTNDGGPVPSLAIVTGAVANGGTALATGDQIYDFVTGLGYGTMSSFTVAADEGTNQTITNGNTLSILGTAPISTAASAADTVTITHDNSGVTANTYAYPASVAVNATGHITSITAGSAPGTMSSFTLAGDTGTNQTITNSDTLTIAGSTGIDTVASATDTITVNLDLAELTTVTTIAPATDYLVGVGGTANEKILYQNVHLNQWGAAEGDISLGSNKITNLADGTGSNDAVNLGQLQSAVAGVGLFKGGYNASTNSPAIAGASNIALDQGDFYVVTTDGTITFSDTTVTVEVGDLIFANGTISANSNPASTAYTIVIADQNIAGSGANDGATEKGVAGFYNGDFSVTANGFVTISNVDLGTQTTGNYVATIEEGDGIDVTGSGSEGAAVTVTLDLNELTATTTPTHLAGNDGSGNTRKFTIANIATEISSANSFAGLIGGSTSIPIIAGTHGLGADSSAFMVQLVEVLTGATVYADVTRGASGLVTIDFAVAPGANSIRVLIQKIG
jgi:hypothetical protein